MFDKLPMYQRIGGAAYKADLNNTVKLLNLLGSPQNKFSSIHIAGTNGKGSVAHLLAAVFQEAGFKTGLYTSPHMKDFRERIRINGVMILPEKVVAFIKANKAEFEAMELSFFEMTVGLAFNYFADEQVDIAIVETGMGGRLDSTNMLNPVLSVITNIGFDHMQFLGDTIEQIATEKAGIIKKGVPVVIGETQAETKAVFEEKAAALKSDIIFADQRFEARKLDVDNPSFQYFDIWRKAEPYIERLEFGLNGLYQQKNVITAICALDMISDRFEINEQHIRAGFSEFAPLTGFLGRWQQLGTKPDIIADAAHNLNGIMEVMSQINIMKFNQLHFILGMVNDKNVDGILQILPRNAIYYFCKADIPRGMDATKLAGKAFEMGLRGEVYHSVSDAYRSAINKAGFEDLIFIGGSTFIVAEVV